MVRFATAFLTLAALRAASASINGTAFTSMYWDCCKPDCAWEGQSDFTKPVLTCDKNDNPLRDLSAQSACDDGPATVCTDQTPWAVNDTFSYGFASVFIKGAELKSWCCSCFELEFTDTSIRGKRMIVQGINTNYNEDEKNYFSLTVRIISFEKQFDMTRTDILLIRSLAKPIGMDSVQRDSTEHLVISSLRLPRLSPLQRIAIRYLRALGQLASGGITGTRMLKAHRKFPHL